MTGYICEICGQFHDELPMAIGFRRPADYFGIPEHELGTRVECTDDMCVIDQQSFFIRGVLELPIKDIDDHFEWGVWAEVSERDFARYIDLWDAEGVEAEPPFEGRLSGGTGYYADTDHLAVTVHLRSGGKRPLFFVVSDQHPLGQDQRAGITYAQVHQFLEACMPHVLQASAWHRLRQKMWTTIRRKRGS